MSYAIRYDPKPEIIRLELDIAVNAPIAKSMVLDAMKLARVHKCKSILVVFSNPSVEDDTMAIYNFAKSLPDLGIDPSVRIAGVLPRQDPDHRFFETVAKNVGYEVRYFTDLGLAEEWLVQRRPIIKGSGRAGQTP